MPRIVCCCSLSLSMWLGCCIFPHPVRCVCGQTIDEYGDHVLGCGHGPSLLQSQFLLKASEYPGAAGDAGEIYRQRWEA